MTAKERRILLGALGFLSFGAVYANVVVTPVLTLLAREFNITTGTAGLVVAAYGLPGVIAALVAGPWSDRIGRKPFLVWGSLGMGAFTALAAVAPTFELLLLTRVFAGIGAGVLFPNIQSLVGDTFPYQERGRAISTVIGLNTLASIIGIPVAGIIAEATSWRISMLLVAVISVAAAGFLFLLVARSRPEGDPAKARALFGQILKNSSAVAAIASSFMGALFWFTWATYVVVYFEHVHALSPSVAATVALTLGLGVLVGSQIGGRLGDRIGHRQIVWSTIAISAVLIVPLTNLPLPLVAAGALNFVMSAVIGARFTTNTALLSQQVPAARGTMMAISASVVSVAIVVGATLGGIFVDGPGFGALGLMCGVLGLLSTAIVLLFVREEPIDFETQLA